MAFARRKRGAFTLMEMIIAIVVMTMITAVLVRKAEYDSFVGDVKKMCSDVGSILNNAVMDTVTGYVNGTGGDCSSDSSYSGISAGRVVDCADIGTAFPYDGTKNTNGSQSWIYGLLRPWTDSGYGCSMYLKMGASDDEYIFLVDCSNLVYDGGSAKYLKYIEEKLEWYTKYNFTTIVRNVYRNAQDINTLTGGTDDDGIVAFRMKK